MSPLVAGWLAVQQQYGDMSPTAAAEAGDNIIIVAFCVTHSITSVFYLKINMETEIIKIITVAKCPYDLASSRVNSFCVYVLACMHGETNCTWINFSFSVFEFLLENDRD